MSIDVPPPLDAVSASKMPPDMIADYNNWRQKQLASVGPNGNWREELATACEQLPEVAQIPYERTPEGERWTRFKKVCDPEFLQSIDRAQLTSPMAFDRVANWNGKFPGPLATGPTGTAKTRSAFSAIGRMFVKENRAYTWFPVKRLIGEFSRYEKKDILDEFYRALYHAPVLLVDDFDKINWQFESEVSVLFQFYDWVYRAQRPCITTTNKDRAWWTDRTGDAFVRRVFDEAHFEVKF